MNQSGDGSIRIRRHRPFVLYWLARFSSSVALQMQTVAVGWQVYNLTNSPLDLGLVGLFQFCPAVLLILVTGHFADRYSRTVIVRLCLLLEGFCAAVLALGTWQGWMTRELIFALVFLFGAARAFEAPTLSAILPGLVPPPMLSRAVAGAASAMQSAFILGPALGGFLYAASPILVYSLCGALFLSAAILTGFLRPARAQTQREPVTFEILFAGIAFVRRHPLILGSISLDLFAVLLGGATALLPIFARDIFQTGPWGLGIMRAAPAIGAICTALILARYPLRRKVGAKMFSAVAIFGTATVVFALSRDFALSLLALFVLGAADMVSVVVRQTLVQLRTPDDMRGRVSAVNMLFIGTSNQLGEFESGATAALFGTVPSVVIGGLGTIMVVLIWMKIFPQLRRADRLELPASG